jgi:hypothetical protein
MAGMGNLPLRLTGDPEADQLLTDDDNALLIGMVLDQQVPMEKAFSGPMVIAQRMGGRLEVAKIAALREDEFVALCAERPAIHRFPAAMAKRIRQVCQVLTEDYDGQAANIWRMPGPAMRSSPGWPDCQDLAPTRLRSSPLCSASSAALLRTAGGPRLATTASRVPSAR